MELVDAATDGRAVAKHEGKVIFVEQGVPGDVADVHVFRTQKKQPIGRIEKLITPSPDRIEPTCQHFEACGGCKWQMMAYDAQLKAKHSHVLNAMQRIGKLEIGEEHYILGSENIFHYRNKLEFTLSCKAWLTKDQIGSEEQHDQRVAGFHVPRIFDKILSIEKCHLQTDLVNDIRNELVRFAKETDISFHDIREHTGFLRNIVFRTSLHSGEIMVTLIVNEDNPSLIDKIFSHLSDKFPLITNLNWIHNEKLNSSYSELPFKVWSGDAFITESLGDFRFQIRPTSFFQTNPAQAKRLYDVVKSFLTDSLSEGQTQHNVVYDLYSGTGSIGIYVSELVNKIVGIEYVEAAVGDARANVRMNNLPESQFNFYAGDIQKLLDESLIQKEGKPDVIITDPPRQGMSPKVVQKVLQLAPHHIIYVSCKPATQARDLEMMKEDYEVLAIQPVDMFPHTAHVENVAFLRRRP